jgi:hypothetical protein
MGSSARSGVRDVSAKVRLNPYQGKGKNVLGKRFSEVACTLTYEVL